MIATAIRIRDVRAAFRLLSEIRRVSESSLWGDVSAVAARGGVLLLVPLLLWDSVAVREVAQSYGAEVVGTGLDPGDVAVASAGVSLDLHPDDPRLRRSVSTLLANATTSWAQVKRGSGAAVRSGDVRNRVEVGMRKRYPEIRIVEEPRGGDEVVWHVYRDRRVA